ncbi:MAG TPA: YciI family protein [Steroidobacteraceae bacterium]|nr:YciI family protein [Steroidobacteraceae bacterium]
MQYMLLAYADVNQFLKMTPEEQKQTYGAYQSFLEAAKKAGAYQASGRLQPASTATSVRVSNGKTQVLNGPYMETKEQLGGFFLLDVPDLDAAISWAARCPASLHGTVEIRPMWISQP